MVDFIASTFLVVVTVLGCSVLSVIVFLPLAWVIAKCIKKGRSVDE